MKKINVLGYLSMALIFLFISCDQQGEIELLESSNSAINIDKSKQILLQPTTLSKSEIDEVSCGESKVVTLTAGQHIDVGTVTVSNDETNLYVVYETTGNWVITETHLYVGPEAGIPLNGGGNPRIGHFPYHGNDDSPFTIPLAGLGDDFVIVAHAVVKKVIDGQTMQSETAFACGEFTFPGNRWGCYFDYEKQECKEDKCMDAFAFKKMNPEHSYCHTYTDENDKNFLGWSNQFNFYWLENKHYQFPIYANVDQCNPVTDPEGYEVGYIDITFFSEGIGDGLELFTTIKYVITNSDYVLSMVNLYVGEDETPLDIEGNLVFTENNRLYSQEVNGLSEYTFTKLDWPGSYNAWDGYVIPHAKICAVKN